MLGCVQIHFEFTCTGPLKLGRRPRDPVSSTASPAREPPVISRVIHNVEGNNRPICNSIERTVERRQVNAIEVRDTILFAKVRGIRALPNHVSPLGVIPEPDQRCLNALPNGLGRLTLVTCEIFPRLESRLHILLNDDRLWPEGHLKPSDSLTLGQSFQEAWACGMVPLNPF
jgi:hypothetical protein